MKTMYSYSVGIGIVKMRFILEGNEEEILQLIQKVFRRTGFTPLVFFM